MLLEVEKIKNFTSKSFPVASDRPKRRSPLCLANCTWTFASSTGPERISWKNPLASGHSEIVTVSKTLLRWSGERVRRVVVVSSNKEVCAKTIFMVPSGVKLLSLCGVHCSAGAATGPQSFCSTASESWAWIDVFPQRIALPC